MEANWVLPAALAIALLGLGSSAGSVSVMIGRQTLEPGAEVVRDGLPAVYRAEIGVQEATGNNDGPRVGQYLQYCGLGEGYEWCAAFVSWCYGQAGYTEPRNAWAAALFPSQKIIWTNAQRLRNQEPKAGDVFGIYIASKKRIAHCGFVDEWDGKWCITVEGNVENAVVRKRRWIKTIRAISRWSNGPSELANK